MVRGVGSVRASQARKQRTKKRRKKKGEESQVGIQADYKPTSSLQLQQGQDFRGAGGGGGEGGVPRHVEGGIDDTGSNREGGNEGIEEEYNEGIIGRKG